MQTRHFNITKKNYLAWTEWKLEQNRLVEQKLLQDSIRDAKQDVILAEKQVEIQRFNSERADKLITEQSKNDVTVKYYLDEDGYYHGIYTAEFNQPKIKHGWQGTAKLTLTYVHGVMSGNATYVSNRRYYDNNLVNVSNMKSIKIMRPTKQLYVQYSDIMPLTKFTMGNGRLSNKVDLTIGNIRYVGTCDSDGYVIGKFEIYSINVKDELKWWCTNGCSIEIDTDGYLKGDTDKLNEWNAWVERNPETYKSMTTRKNANLSQVDYQDSEVGRQSTYITLFDDSDITLPKYKTILVPTIPNSKY
jgi:hypothetical protein